MRVLTLVFFFLSFLAQAQNLEQVKKDVKTLAAPEMHGRGYVNGGLEKASDFLLNRLESLGLEVSTQSYEFSVNTFPEKSKIRCGKRKFKEGEEFIINPGSPAYRGRGESILLDSADFQDRNLPALPSKGMIPVIKTEGIDTPEEVSAKYDWTKRATEVAPVVELKDKLTWSVGREVYANPVVPIKSDVYDTG